MYFGDLFLTRGRLPLSSFLCFVGGFSMGSWLTLFHQLQAEKDLGSDMRVTASNEPLLLLAVMIVSAPGNGHLRTTLRSTWLKLIPSSPKLKHVFIIGTQGLTQNVLENLQEEDEQHDDLLLLHDLQDTFQNLSEKVSEGMVHLSKFSPFHYLLKCDDDSFVRLDKILSELEQREREEEHRLHNNSPREALGCYYWGFFDGRAPVQKKGKWKEKGYPLCDNYVPYALGGGYVLSKPCTDFILKNQDVLRTYLNEDVTVGTWLSIIAPQRKHDERFDTEWESRGCKNEYLIQHKVSQSEMLEKYRNLLEKGRLCTEEWRRRGGYKYDWDAPPSQCCHRNSSII